MERNLQAQRTRDLRNEFERLRIEFANADLDVALTFARLSASDLQSGKSETAARLLNKARYAADEIGKIVADVTGPTRGILEHKLQAVRDAIRKAATGEKLD